jgi:hypothetical protein
MANPPLALEIGGVDPVVNDSATNSVFPTRNYAAFTQYLYPSSFRYLKEIVSSRLIYLRFMLALFTPIPGWVNLPRLPF